MVARPPRRLDARIELVADDRTDIVSSYVGLRFMATVTGELLLNGASRARARRAAAGLLAVVASHSALGARDARRDRAHQGARASTPPAFTRRSKTRGSCTGPTGWACSLWTEMPSAFEYSDAAVLRLTKEWTEVIRRDSSHPSVIVWVRSTRAGPSARSRPSSVSRHWPARSPPHEDARRPRPVISNDGWEHTQSDLLTIHDYENDHETLTQRHGTREAGRQASVGISPFGKRVLVGTDEETAATASAPAILSELAE